MHKNDKPVILVFLGYYLPGFKAGGPLRSIANMLEHLNANYTFKLITRDRDLGDQKPYSNISVNKWIKIEGNQFYYISPEKIQLKNLRKIIKETEHDIMYFNSFFDPNFTVKPLLLNRFCLKPSSLVILAPRGEFSEGALSLKPIKKKLFIQVIRCLGLYKSVVFHASSEFEKSDILSNSPFKKNKIKIALDLPSKIDLDDQKFKRAGDNSIMRIVFLSRISPMKNLKYALQILSSVTRDIQFDIYGPLEDQIYWIECQKIINKLPKNIIVNYKSSVEASRVVSILKDYDLFFLPSKGENYCHVVAESLSAGTPVLISNNTPWKNLEIESIGWALDLNEFEKYVSVIEGFNLSEQDRQVIQKAAIKRIINPKHIKDNIVLFSK